MNFAITKSQLAKELGVARSTLHRWEELPGFPTATKKGWNLDACHKFVEKNGLTAPSELAEERRLLVRAQRLLAEQRLRREAGELVPIQEVKERMAHIYGIFTGIVKRTVPREDWNAIARQFQDSDLKL